MRAATQTQRDAIRGMLADLKMPGSLEAVDGILSEIDGGCIAATDAISRLLTAQITLRNNRRLQAALPTSSPSTHRPRPLLCGAREGGP
jgi:hypothetical protein